MNHQDPSSSVLAIEKRLVFLEARNRRLKVGQLLLCAGFVAFISISARQPIADTITAKQFILKDSRGNDCAVWSSEPAEGQGTGCAYLTFRSEHGVAVHLEAGSGNPSLQLNGSGTHWAGVGTTYATLAVDATAGPQLELLTYKVPSDAAQGSISTLSTLIGTPYSANDKCLIVTRNQDELWSAPASK
jgi:hypothetical protein